MISPKTPVSGKSSIFRQLRQSLLVSAVAIGIAGYAIGSSGVFSVSASMAEAVKVEAPQAFSFADVVEAVSPAVVSVRVEAEFQPVSHQGGFRFDRRFSPKDENRFREYFKNLPGFDNRSQNGRDHEQNRHPRRFGQSQGSGFFVSADGYVVTNHHVVENGSKFTIILDDGNEFDASLVGADVRTDLAVLKIESKQDFTYVDFSKDKPRIGEWVVAVGNPFGLGGTVTAGIVSAHGREIGKSSYGDFIQIDAAVNKGNSGGPAFNLQGEVIGINAAIFSPSGGNVGIAFAIPASTAREVVDDLIDNGKVVRGWLGVQIQPVTTEIAESLGLELSGGAIVTLPEDGSPADEAGITSGDIITAVDGNKIKGPRELARAIGSREPQTAVDLEIWRNGDLRNITVTLGKLNSPTSKHLNSGARSQKLARLGLEIEGLVDGDGVLVRGVEPGSGAERKGIKAGDVIVSVNGEDVSDPSSLVGLIDKFSGIGRKAALLQIRRGDEIILVPVPLELG